MTLMLAATRICATDALERHLAPPGFEWWSRELLGRSWRRDWAMGNVRHVLPTVKKFRPEYVFRFGWCGAPALHQASFKLTGRAEIKNGAGPGQKRKYKWVCFFMSVPPHGERLACLFVHNVFSPMAPPIPQFETPVIMP